MNAKRGGVKKDTAKQVHAGACRCAQVPTVLIDTHVKEVLTNGVACKQAGPVIMQSSERARQTVIEFDKLYRINE